MTIKGKEMCPEGWRLEKLKKKKKEKIPWKDEFKKCGKDSNTGSKSDAFVMQ